MKRLKQKPTKKLQKPPAPATTPGTEHRRQFDKLLDDAIFGVKKQDKLR